MSAYHKTLFAMDTYFDLTVYGSEAEAAPDAAEREVRRLEGLWAVTDENSELSAINRSGGAAVEISGETETLLAASLSIAEETWGVFDPTIYPVLSAWGFTTQEYRIPERDEIYLTEGISEAFALSDPSRSIHTLTRTE